MTEQKQSMNAIIVRKPGGPKTLEYAKIPRPESKEGEVLIRVKAAGINRPDIFQREGHYDPPPGASAILGLEVAGIREDTGEKTCALLTGGGYAEYACAYKSLCLPIPEGLSFAAAAALPECVFTVWKNIFKHGAFKPGETVLVHGGTSGIGTTAIQMIKAFGGTVLVTCGNEKKCLAAKDIGADLAVNYNQEDFKTAVLAHTGGRGVDIVLDMVGGDYVRRNLDCLAENGRHVSIAFLRGAKAEIIVPNIMKKRLTLTGSMLRPRPVEEKAVLAQEIREKVWPKIKAGEITPVLYKTLPLKDAAKAHEIMENGAHIGKIVLTV